MPVKVSSTPLVRNVSSLTKTGDNGLKEYDMRSTKGRKNKPPTRAQSALDDHFRIYFPSHDTVMQSRGGKDVSACPLGLLESRTE